MTKKIAEKKESKESSDKGKQLATRKPIRFHPGTVAARQIKRLANAPDIVFVFEPMNRYIRKLAKETCGSNEEVKFQKGVIHNMLAAGAHYIIDNFSFARAIAVNSAKHPKVMITPKHYMMKRLLGRVSKCNVNI